MKGVGKSSSNNNKRILVLIIYILYIIIFEIILGYHFGDIWDKFTKWVRKISKIRNLLSIKN